MQGIRRILKCVLVMFMVVGLFPQGESDLVGSFGLCYGACLLRCIVTEHKVLRCGTKCLKQWIFPSKPISPDHLTHHHHGQQNHYFCKLGCGIFSCANISSIPEPREVEVGRCVEACSGACTKNFSP